MGLRFLNFEKKKSGHQMAWEKKILQNANFFLKLSIRGTHKSLDFWQTRFLLSKKVWRRKNQIPSKKGVVNFVFFDSWKC